MEAIQELVGFFDGHMPVPPLGIATEGDCAALDVLQVSTLVQVLPELDHGQFQAEL